MLRVAFLISAHHHFVHLGRLLSTLLDYRGIETSIYLHVDRKSPVEFSFPHERVFIEENRIPVYWGGMSQVSATLRLMRRAAAAQGGYDYYCCLTGQDYPVRSEAHFLGLLARNRNYINLRRMPFETKPMRRLANYWFEHDRRRPSARRVALLCAEAGLRALRVRKSVPFIAYGGSQHFFLNRDCVSHVLQFCGDNPWFVDFHRTALCPDESFFQTIVGNSTFIDSVEPSLVYANWAAEGSNFRFTERDVGILKAEPTRRSPYYGEYSPCFARKFFDDDSAMLEMVHRQLH